MALLSTTSHLNIFWSQHWSTQDLMKLLKFSCLCSSFLIIWIWGYRFRWLNIYQSSYQFLVLGINIVPIWIVLNSQFIKDSFIITLLQNERTKHLRFKKKKKTKPFGRKKQKKSQSSVFFSRQFADFVLTLNWRCRESPLMSPESEDSASPLSRHLPLQNSPVKVSYLYIQIRHFCGWIPCLVFLRVLLFWSGVYLIIINLQFYGVYIAFWVDSSLKFLSFWNLELLAYVVDSYLVNCAKVHSIKFHALFCRSSDVETSSWIMQSSFKF